MKPTNSGYTLLESLIVLGLVAGILLLSTTNQSPQINMSRWTTAFDSRWQQTRILAQTKQQTCIVSFQTDGVRFEGKKLAYPNGYHNKKPQTVRVLPTGYVAPTTVTISRGTQNIKIIFSLGGGAYRLVQT